MTFLRYFAGVLLLVAALALAGDVTRAMGGGGFRPTSTLTQWRAVAPQSVAAAQTTVSRAIHPFVWDSVIAQALSVPAWFLFGAAGLLLAWFSRRRRRTNIYGN